MLPHVGSKRKSHQCQGPVGVAMVKKSETERKGWRRGWESNPRIKVLQTSPLPLGYRALSSKLSPHVEKVYGAPCRKSAIEANTRHRGGL